MNDWNAPDRLGEDTIDVRDIIRRVEELRELRDNAIKVAGEDGHEFDQDEESELKLLEDALADMRGMGGDEQWEGAWYPITLILDSHFEDYAREFAEEIGAFNKVALWPACYIDWSAAAEALQQDYTMVTIDGYDYWFR